jgi:hypothetical protein
MRRVGVVPIAAGLLLLSGCTAQYTTPPEDPIAAARALPDAPAAVQNGDGSCGELELGEGEDLPASAVACVMNAPGSAELAWSTPTTEGDPIVSFAQVSADFDGVHIYRTSAFDNFGAEGWAASACVDRHDLGAADECVELVEP